MRIFRSLFSAVLFCLASFLAAQRGPHPGAAGRGDHHRAQHFHKHHYKHHKHYKHHHGHAMHRHSKYRPHRVMIFRPYWAPQYRFYRRWVYFPGMNIYWDNWRNHYVFFDGHIWISRPHPPRIYRDRDFEKEKRSELSEREDDTDDIYRGNEGHRKIKDENQADSSPQ